MAQENQVDRICMPLPMYTSFWATAQTKTDWSSGQIIFQTSSGCQGISPCDFFLKFCLWILKLKLSKPENHRMPANLTETPSSKTFGDSGWKMIVQPFTFILMLRAPYLYHGSDFLHHPYFWPLFLCRLHTSHFNLNQPLSCLDRLLHSLQFSVLVAFSHIQFENMHHTL